MSEYGGRLAAAVLGCGAVLVFPDAHLRPRKGDLMPCLRHDFCLVVGHQHAAARHSRQHVQRVRAGKSRLPRRTVDELLAHLTGTPSTTTRALLAQRFTLRLVVQAQAAGLLDADLVSGNVTARADARGDAGQGCAQRPADPSTGTADSTS